MHLILTGATGVIGAGVLQNMLTMESVSRISILSRRPVAMAEGHSKAKVYIHKDFKKYDKELLEELKDAKGVVWALGVSQFAVNKQEYHEITYDYPLAAAEAFSTLHPQSPFTFVFISGAGATQNPTMFTSLYGRVKGEAEQALLDIHKKNPNLKLYNMRPGAVDWRSQPEIHATMPQQPLLKRAAMPIMDSLYQNRVIQTGPLGKACTELAMSDGEPLAGKDIEMDGRLILNEAIKRLANGH